MEDDEINYRTLRKIQQMEKNSPTLTDLRPDFYENLSEYLKNLDNRFECESSSQKQMLLKDEMQNTKKIATSIYEQREKKVLLAAITKARGGNPDQRGPGAARRPGDSPGTGAAGRRHVQREPARRLPGGRREPVSDPHGQRVRHGRGDRRPRGAPGGQRRGAAPGRGGREAGHEGARGDHACQRHRERGDQHI